jgi:hypothetical protein
LAPMRPTPTKPMDFMRRIYRPILSPAKLK